MAAHGKVPLLLVPGLLCDAALWQPQVERLSDIADCQVADHTRSDTMHAVAADVLRDSPFEKFALAGLSMGGYVALEMMRQAPARIARLALLDTSARADTPERSQNRREFIALAQSGRFVGVTSVLLQQFIHPSRYGDAGLVATVREMAKNIGKDAFVRQQRAIISRADSLPLLASIACRTLVLCGRQDALTPVERHEEIALAIPGAQLEIIEDCGHLSTLERPEEVSRAMRAWLTA